MSKYLIKHSGPLRGEVKISGAKNAVLPLMAAALLSSEECVLDEVPDLRDVILMREILESLGAKVSELRDSRISIKTEEITNTDCSSETVNKMRASILILGPILARTGKVRVSLPGGCAIGKRPIDLHLKGMEALGCTITENEFENYIEVIANENGLNGDTIYLDFPSVGATENIMMAAVLAKGITMIENAAEEPEIVDLANFLNKMGARIKGAGTDTIRIEGVEKLHAAHHTVIPDRIEAGTFMLAAAITRGRIHITNAIPDHLRPIIAKLRESGVEIDVEDEGLIVKADVNPLKAVNIKTLPYPGFPTDIQSPFMAYLSTVEGRSEVIETVFENRFMHVSQLNKMGAKIETAGNKADIIGVGKLWGSQVMATDLRAGAALVIAALRAEGETEISEIYHIERGYEKFIEKYTKLGAEISLIEG